MKTHKIISDCVKEKRKAYVVQGKGKDEILGIVYGYLFPDIFFVLSNNINYGIWTTQIPVDNNTLKLADQEDFHRLRTNFAGYLNEYNMIIKEQKKLWKKYLS